jgi:potassium efflux system protein
MRSVREAITPIDLGVAIFVLTITVFLSRNMPGMFDFVLLQRIGIDASLRYALTSVIGYLLTFIGLTYAFSLLGFRWEQIQWLAAALTFGLSFGLQEIFANFVSGLIILFERPVRIGDIVTIEGVTGVVTKIRIRASTITDWDRKEYLVPNKELVTGRLLNWTLSDTLNRISIPIGVAYGSDTDRVREVLFEIVRAEPELLKDPGPMVVFDSFGDSALNFVVRAFLASLEKRMETVHRLHSNIHKRFMQEGIEIAFPQQDLHLRTIPREWMPQSPLQQSAGKHPSNGAGESQSRSEDNTESATDSTSPQAPKNA